MLGNLIYEGGEIVNDFDAIYQQYGKTVYCFLLSLSRDESLAEELTQETMFRAIMNINSFRGDSKPSVWLCQIGKNLYFEWLKKSKRTIPIDDSLATYDIRPAQEKESEKQLEDTMQEKPFLIMLLNANAKQEASRLLGEDAEERQARQMVMQRQKEQRTVPQNQSKKKEHWER